MKCLLIEDNHLKADIIARFVESLGWPLSVEKSYQSGLRAALSGQPEVILLDMTLPNFDVTPGKRHGKPRPLGGYDLMRKLRRAGAKPKVLVLTQYEAFGDGRNIQTFVELTERCKREFPDIFVDAVQFSAAQGDWRELVKSILGGDCGQSSSS